VWLEERVKELLRAGVPWRPGAKELLGALNAAGVPLALVTATHRHLVDVALLTIGAEHFDAVVAGDEVDETKPHPMPYLTAAAMVGAEARNCVAVEDSPNGITSARAAGCAVLAVPCEIELDPEGVTLAGSLLDVDVDYLRKLVV
jgi:HAD superfamily hydrolase (TIGR01509 family)